VAMTDHILDEPNTFVFAGDWHQNEGWATSAIRSCGARHDVDSIFHLGDFLGFGRGNCNYFLNQVERALVEAGGIQLGFVDGNHENFPFLHKFLHDDRGVAHLRPHIAWLPRGLRWEWDGLKFMALGGATSMDKVHRTPMVSWFQDEEITWAQAEEAIAGGPVDVVIAHDAPDGVLVPGLYMGWPEEAMQRANGHRAMLSEVAQAILPAVWVHGHFHVRYNGAMLMAGHATGEEYHMICVGLDKDGGSMDKNLLATTMGELRDLVASARAG
jgi:predicted phosphodiesterase